MPTFEGTEYAKRNATPPKFVSQTSIGGKLRCMKCNFTAPTGGLAVADIVKLAEMPRGSVVVGHMSRFKSSLLGAARTWDLGYAAHTNEETDAAVAADVDAFVDGADASAAVDMLFTAATVGGNAPEHEAVGKYDLIATLAGDTMAAAETLEAWIFYLEP